MIEYQGKVVAITGAGSGIGRSMATRFAEKGARLSLADINAKGLADLEKELKGQGVEVVTSVVDVRDCDAVVKFADKTFGAYGEVDFDINNAGISSLGSIFKIPVAEWRLAFDINVMGVVHGIRAFGPRMIAQDKECYIINTVSAAGLESTGGLPAYFMSKHAALSVTESLAIELQMSKAKVKAFAFCPGLIPTNLSVNSRSIRDDDPYYQTDEYKMLIEAGSKALAHGMPMDQAMEAFFAGLEADHFYIRPHMDEEDQVGYRVKMVLNKTRPAPKGLR